MIRSKMQMDPSERIQDTRDRDRHFLPFGVCEPEIILKETVDYVVRHP